MRTYTPEELKKIIADHLEWITDNSLIDKRADLSEADLSEADLSEADLSEADLSGANLYGANLYGADLSGANLSEADLSGANLSGADLSSADLSGADLSSANLSGANLSGADYNDIKISKAIFITGIYQYVSGSIIAETGEKHIKLGCHTRLVSEWESNFWNNRAEFPNDNSEGTLNRIKAYNMHRIWLNLPYHDPR